MYLCIKKWKSEPHQHHQNPAEPRYQTVKNATNHILDRTDAPAHLQYVCYLLNHTNSMTIDAVPLTKLLGSTVDISPLHFLEHAYNQQFKTSFPSDSNEGLGHIVGISEHFVNMLEHTKCSLLILERLFTVLSYIPLLLMTLICMPTCL
jgi:hypothetical protein